MAVPRVWELVRCFKDECNSLGWVTSRDEDWVQADNKYHNFLWTRTIHPSTFKRLAKSSKCAVHEGISYRVVDVTYSAWLFYQSPPEEIVKALIDDPVLARSIAIYDLSCLYSGNPTCSKLNLTNSKVFREFETFLRKRWGVNFRSAQGMLTAEV